MKRIYAIIAILVVVVFTSGLFEAHAVPTEANNTLLRIPGSLVFGPKTVWSKGSTTDWVFHPLSAPMPSGDIISVRVDTLMDQDTGNCKVRPALRYYSDGVTWDGSKDIIAAYRTSPGIDFGTAYIDLTALGVNSRAYVQFGVQVANESGEATEYCNAALRVQVKEQ